MENKDFIRLYSALADIRKRQILLSKFDDNTKYFYPDSYAFAIRNSVYPIQHEDRMMEDDSDAIYASLPFYDTYDVPCEQVEELATMLDEKWLAKEKITFYGLERHYGYRSGNSSWKGTHVRVGLLHCLRYFYLQDLFDEEFWKEILSDSPSEAKGITREFQLSELASY